MTDRSGGTRGCSTEPMLLENSGERTPTKVLKGQWYCVLTMGCVINV
jgi:hypothetical protein